MTGFPGLETGFDGSALFTPELCRETLMGLYAQGARDLFVMVEPDELDEVGFQLLETTASEVGMSIIYYPIPDYSVPSEELTTAWMARRPEREALLRGNGTIAFSCQYGAGRSGLMACWTLMEAGLSADEAISLARTHFSEAVESGSQKAWLHALVTG
ncbi:hypothetical protein [Gymnodinialimonas sp. 57CJ19]|uniref:hypothetical protein n=1 Tax=Gymnodinialimonas sp. 57CJ19 TaxID=3138498 RepID=UPI0031343567